ncbi:MAG: hypothetical protein VYE68_05935 [Acidobacteriota bacterium]|nr:hypothetical protein [Acidobacteriota bacterium]
MMPRRAFIVTSVAPLLTGAGSFTTAEAASFWDVVGDVRIGGVHFAVGFHSSRHPRYRRYRGRYYRTRQRLQYRRYRCGGACHRHDGSDYHHEACPLFGAHRRHYAYESGYYRRGYRDPYADRYYDERPYRRDRYDDNRYYQDGRYYRRTR